MIKVLLALHLLFPLIRALLSDQAIGKAPAGISKIVGKRSEYASKLCAAAVRAGQLKLAPSVKAYYNKNPGVASCVVHLLGRPLVVMISVYAFQVIRVTRRRSLSTLTRPSSLLIGALKVVLGSFLIIHIFAWSDESVFQDYEWDDSVWQILDTLGGTVRTQNRIHRRSDLCVEIRANLCCQPRQRLPLSWPSKAKHRKQRRRLR